MEITRVADVFFKTRYSVFKWRYELAITDKIVLAFFMAGFTGLMAQIKVFLPWTPVPITGQTFAALLAGVLLGRWWGGISQAIYVILGAVGIPWFAGATGGYSVLIGPSGGYLIGFIFGALFVGHFIDKYIKARGLLSLFCLMLFANFVLIYAPGLIQLGIWFRFIKGTSPTPWQLLSMGAIPFIIGDIIKVVAAATLAKCITPKEAFNGEVDAKITRK
jgi:biotin transport system substrate-specific component